MVFPDGVPFSIGSMVLNLSTTIADVQLDSVVTAGSYQLAKAFVSHGMGVCIADEVTARSGTHDGVDIRELKPDLKFRIAALHTDRESISLICTDFIKHLKRSLRAYLKPSS